MPVSSQNSDKFQSSSMNGHLSTIILSVRIVSKLPAKFSRSCARRTYTLLSLQPIYGPCLNLSLRVDGFYRWPSACLSLAFFKSKRFVTQPSRVRGLGPCSEHLQALISSEIIVSTGYPQIFQLFFGVSFFLELPSPAVFNITASDLSIRRRQKFPR